MAENEEFTRFIVRTEVFSKGVKKNSYSFLPNRSWELFNRKPRSVASQEAISKVKNMGYYRRSRNPYIFFWGCTVPNRIPLISLVLALGLWTMPEPAVAQALLPYTLQIDSAQLEQTALSLAEEAVQLARLQQYELAVPRAELATQLAPKNAQTWTLLGSLYLQVEQFDKGIEALGQAQSLSPENASIKFVLGEAHFRKANYQKAVEYLQAGLKLQPDTPGALFDLGNSFYKLKRFDQAIAQYEKAFALEKNLWPAINNIGLVKYEMGDVDGAIKRWEQAIALDDKAAESMLALAVALYGKGDQAKGLAMGEAALKLDKRYATVEYLKENLWGDRLIADTQKLLATPEMKAALDKIQDTPPPPM